jgi:hypothetical protein
MIETDRYVKAYWKMGRPFFSVDRFIPDAMNWLAINLGDLHIEYHKDEGWQVSTCFTDGSWDDDGWISADDGSLAGALMLAVEAIKK